MPTFPPSDPTQALVFVALAVVVVVVAGATWWQLVKQVRRHGGGWLAAGALALAILGLLVAIAPSVLPFETGIVVLILALAAMYRPDLVVKVTGGPSLRYRALREGRELQVLVRERGGWSVARRNEEVRARVKGLAAFEGPGTERYVSLVRETVLADPEAPGVAEKVAALAEAEAEMRASLKARPMFDKGLDRRAAALLLADPEAEAGAAPEGGAPSKPDPDAAPEGGAASKPDPDAAPEPVHGAAAEPGPALGPGPGAS